MKISSFMVLAVTAMAVLAFTDCAARPVSAEETGAALLKPGSAPDAQAEPPFIAVLKNISQAYTKDDFNRFAEFKYADSSDLGGSRADTYVERDGGNLFRLIDIVDKVSGKTTRYGFSVNLWNSRWQDYNFAQLIKAADRFGWVLKESSHTVDTFHRKDWVVLKFERRGVQMIAQTWMPHADPEQYAALDYQKNILPEYKGHKLEEVSVETIIISIDKQ